MKRAVAVVRLSAGVARWCCCYCLLLDQLVWVCCAQVLFIMLTNGYTNSHYAYSFGNWNGKAAVAEFQQRWPDRNVLHWNVFQNVNRIFEGDEFLQTWLVADSILDAVQNRPVTDVCWIYVKSCAALIQVWRASCGDGFYPSPSRNYETENMLLFL